MLCLLGARYSMTAIILSQGEDNDLSTTTVPAPNGSYVRQQNPETGDIIRVWVPEDSDDVSPGIQIKRFSLEAKGIIDGGIRVAATTQRYTPGGRYENIDYIMIKFPANVTLTKRDRVTDIRNSKGVLLWKEEEFTDAPTVFTVEGVVPITDPFGMYVENSALLQRSEIQEHG